MVPTPDGGSGDPPTDPPGDETVESTASDDAGGGADDGGIGRRDVLKYGAAAAVLGAAGAGGYTVLRGGGDGDAPGEWNTIDGGTTGDGGGSGDGGDGSDGDGAGGDGDVPDVVARFAPTIRFGRHERWYPADPRPYAGDGGDERVVDGFAALDGYTRERKAAGEPPEPVVFYRALAEQNSALGVVQYWMYSAFDQFAVNFHWHDWELLQVFFDRESGEAALVSASAHSRKVPNNEYLGKPDGGVSLLSEVGSHSSATDVNESGTFDRIESGDLAADVTNALLRIAGSLDVVPLAYGLPRDEGLVLPYSVPELDGAPLYEHPDLPSVTEADLVDSPLAIRDLDDLESPPTDVPAREDGVRLVPAATDAGGGEDDVPYDLRPMGEVADAIDDFVGPQLSFEFAVPGVVEDQFAKHLTSVSIPWEQPRYDDPLADVTDAAHRQQIVEEFGVGEPDVSGGMVVARVQEASADTDGELRGAPDGALTELEPEIGYSLSSPGVESVALLESEPVAAPTTGGVVRFTDVEPGEHRLVVDGAGYAPHAERLAVGGAGTTTTTATTTTTTATTATDDGSDPAQGVTLAGADGFLTAVPDGEAVKLRGDASGARNGLAAVSVAEDYAGGVFQGRPAVTEGDDGEGFAVYAHRAGSYVVDVVDGDGVPGTARVDPGEDDDGEAVEFDAGTGKASVAGFLARYLRESADLTREYRREAETTTTKTTTRETTAETTTTTETTTTSRGNGGGGNGGSGNDDDTTTTTTTATTTDGSGNGGDGGGPGGAGVAEVFDSAADAAERGAEFARDGNLQGADRQFEAVRNRLDAVLTRVEAQRGTVLSETLATVLRTRAEGSDRRAKAALDAER